jgi:hypothetical protein
VYSSWKAEPESIAGVRAVKTASGISSVAVVKAAEARHPPTLPTRNVRGVRTIGATTARVRRGYLKRCSRQHRFNEAAGTI